MRKSRHERWRENMERIALDLVLLNGNNPITKGQVSVKVGHGK